MSSVPLVKALRMARLRDHEAELAAAIHSGAPAGDLLFGLRDPNRIDVAVVNTFIRMPVSAAVASPRCEIALAWIATDMPVTVHLYMNQDPIPGASGTVRGGRAFFTVPDAMIVDAKYLTYALSFWQGRWKYQVWGRIGDKKFLLAHGDDPDPSTADDDRVLETVKFALTA